MYSVNILLRAREYILCYTPSRGGIIDLYHDVDVLEVTGSSRSLPRATLIVRCISNIKGKYTPVP